MARVLVLQHVAAEPLGVLDPMLRRAGHRIRFVNFARDPDAEPQLDRYQAFRAGTAAWAFQFHLELDERLIRRWLTLDFYRDDLARSGLERTPEDIRAATREHLPGTLGLADEVFGNWLERLEAPQQRIVLGSP